VTASDTLTILRTGDPWEGLKNFHRAVLDAAGRAQDAEARQRWYELKRAAAEDRASVQGFSMRLAAIANQVPEPAARRAGDALLEACRAMGQAKGIEVREPRQASDDEQDGAHALEQIARSSGFYARRIALPGDWALASSAEPLLAHRADPEARPVALLPASNRGALKAPRFEMYDPVIDRSVPVTEAVADQVSREAWMFYPTLPDHALK
jgi:hypothetical protein